MKPRNRILCIICMWSVFCSVRIYISLHFLPAFFVKLGFGLSVFWFFMFLYFLFLLFCSIFWIRCHLKRLNNILIANSAVIRQKSESQNRCFKKTKHAKFSEKRTFLTPWYAHVTCAYQGIRNVRFSENLVCFVFLKHLFWDSPFCLITDELHDLWFCSHFIQTICYIIRIVFLKTCFQRSFQSL